MDTKKSLFLLLSAILIVAVVYLSFSTQNSANADENLVKRGEYLVGIGGCHDCHTPKKMTSQIRP